MIRETVAGTVEREIELRYDANAPSSSHCIGTVPMNAAATPNFLAWHHPRLLSSALGVVLLTSSACTDESAGTGCSSVADSAGIRIVTIQCDPSNVPHWTSRVDLTVGLLDGPPEYTFGEVADVAVRANGSLFVLDRFAQSVRVFGRDGTFLMTVGGPGEGPGELSAIAVRVRIGSNDSIFVLENIPARLHVYAPSGAPASTRAIRVDHMPGPYDFHLLDGRRALVRWFTYDRAPDGRFVPWDVLLRSDTLRESFDSVSAFRYTGPDVGGMGGINQPLIVNAAFYDLLPDQRVVWSALEYDEVVIQSVIGEVSTIVRNLDWRVRPATDADRDLLTAAYRARPGNSDGPLPPNLIYPDSIPTIVAVATSDDGHFWVRRMADLNDLDPMGLMLPVYAGQLGGRTWEVYSSDGTLEAIAELPPRFRITRIAGDEVYGVQKDELDVERVLRVVVSKLQN